MEISSEDLELCASILEDEITVVQSVYPESSRVNQEGLTGESPSDVSIVLEIPVDLGETREVKIIDDGTIAASSAAVSPGTSATNEEGNTVTQSSQNNITTTKTATNPDPHSTISHAQDTQQTATLQLSSLPPIIVSLQLPPAYPLHAPPEILSLHSTHAWLSPSLVSCLRAKVFSLWDECRASGEGVLWRLVQYVRNGDFIPELSLLDDTAGAASTDTTITTAVPLRIPHAAPQLLAPRLQAYDAHLASSLFDLKTFTCAICLSPHKGSACIALSCAHVFCKDCLREFWGTCIAEGEVERVMCPDEECVKGGRKAREEEVRSVVLDERVVERWKWIRQKIELEKDPTTVHCPMEWCQAPVRRPRAVKEEEEESQWDRLRTCQSCQYSFCVLCKRTWHGPLTVCPPSVTMPFVLEYMSAGADSPKRREIERRLGKNNIERLVARYQEEELNKKWIDQSTMACPGCEVKVEKSLGCNHMTCARCGCHFCYRCGQKLPPKEPYKHFSTRGIDCYEKLFDGETGRGAGDGAGVDWGIEALAIALGGA